MKETHWRTKLIRMWRKRTNPSFIWAHDAKFKAGFPDLFTIVDGRFTHYELKVKPKAAGNFEQLRPLFAPLQVAILKQIAHAGGNAVGLVLREDYSVVLINFKYESVRYLSPHEFEYAWLNWHTLA